MDFSKESPCVFRPQSIARILSLKTCYRDFVVSPGVRTCMFWWIKQWTQGASLVAQWWRVCLTIQDTQAQDPLPRKIPHAREKKEKTNEQWTQVHMAQNMIFLIGFCISGGLKRSKGGRWTWSTYPAQQSIVANLSCKVSTFTLFIYIPLSIPFSSASYITGWICWTASMGFWQMLDRQWRICHGCSCVIGRKKNNWKCFFWLCWTSQPYSLSTAFPGICIVP